ncbi:active regulator of SIRT1-like [Prorops nasuta]|uniref:active regulator of SIRT1-like n=1 Tax=Prorops nasuta TaxID=863751 RepID=UPI0034CD845D
MANLLVHKSLELLGFESSSKQEKKKRKQTKYNGTLDLIPAKHRITSHDEIDVNTVLRKRSINIYQAMKKLQEKQDPTEDNVRKLLLLSSSHINSETADKLINRTVKLGLKKQEKKKAPETTAFTEEDFKKFEQEYCE